MASTTPGLTDLGTVSQFDVRTGGAVTPKNPPTVAAGFSPNRVAVSPISAPPLPTSKDQCKTGGWRNYPDFKNEGACVSFVATGGKNAAG